MDISVSRLNGRLAAKLPPELPLGLVFVVGRVSQVGGRRFLLIEDHHRLNCQAVEEIKLREGDEVRASGHLMFDAERLQYYLLARDVELVMPEPLLTAGEHSREFLVENEGLLAALAAVKARAAVAPMAKSTEMPLWVKKLAPPEVQTSLPEAATSLEAEVGDVDTAVSPKHEVALDAGLLSMLSAAMDSEEDLELTPELLAPYQVVPDPVAQPEEAGHVDRLMDTAVPTTPTSYQPANRQDTDWLVILLIISFLVLTIAAIVTIVLLIL
ncbi:MAG: exodeoxyribonuclease VII large subunit [Candidatus Promineifilaceae bacterium]|nr:exodeoxyribonuclease VII large subunit [Anaerolineaceae bacterium]